MVTSNLLRWQVARRLAKEKMPGRIPTLPLFQSLRFANQLQFLLPFDALSCPPMGGGGILLGRDGEG